LGGEPASVRAFDEASSVHSDASELEPTAKDVPSLAIAITPQFVESTLGYLTPATVAPRRMPL
jgi:hypothetical protein